MLEQQLLPLRQVAKKQFSKIRNGNMVDQEVDPEVELEVELEVNPKDS